jgi:hypothetical protein
MFVMWWRQSRVAIGNNGRDASPERFFARAAAAWIPEPESATAWIPEPESATASHRDGRPWWLAVLDPDPDAGSSEHRRWTQGLAALVVPLSVPSAMDPASAGYDPRWAPLLDWSKEGLREALGRMADARLGMRLGPYRTTRSRVVDVRLRRSLWDLLAVFYVPGASRGRVARLKVLFDASDPADPERWTVRVAAAQDAGVLSEIHVTWPLPSAPSFGNSVASDAESV